ncbi:MAG: hypothetical protein ACI910_002957 [Oleispira sp.]|jgi:hypothetical protein
MTTVRARTTDNNIFFFSEYEFILSTITAVYLNLNTEINTAIWQLNLEYESKGGIISILPLFSHT